MFEKLRNEKRYSLGRITFNIKNSKLDETPCLYLRSNHKLSKDINEPLFIEEKYNQFQITDIHVTILADNKKSSHFHITVNLYNQDSEEKITIHDFYTTLDLSRDFHIKLSYKNHDSYHEVFLPKNIIQINSLNDLIAQEISLVSKLIQENNQYEKSLITTIQETNAELYSLAREKYSDLIPFTERFFDYIEQDHKTVSNLKQFDTVVLENRTRVSANSIFSNNKSSSSFEHFKTNIVDDPYGSTLIIDTIYIFILRALKQHLDPSATSLTNEQLKANTRENTRKLKLTQTLIAYLNIIISKIETKSLLKTFEIFMNFQPIDLLNNTSLKSLIQGENMPSLDKLSDFQMECVGPKGFYYLEPLKELYAIIINELKHRILQLSTSTITNHIKYYLHELRQCIQSVDQSSANTADNCFSFLLDSYNAIFLKKYSTIAYFIFCIKAKTNKELLFDDYQAMFYCFRFIIEKKFIGVTRYDSMFQLYCENYLEFIKNFKLAFEQLELSEDLRDSLVNCEAYQYFLQTESKINDEISNQENCFKK